MTRRAAPHRPPNAALRGGIGGFTLLELLVSLLLTGAFAAGAHRLCLSALQAVQVLEVTSRLHEGARVALMVMARDLRETGYGLAPGRGLREASWDAVRIARDLNGDGDTDDENERLAYRLDAVARRIQRQLGDGSPQPMLEELAPDASAFTYYDGAGAALPARSPLAPAQCERVRRIDLQLALEAPHPSPGAAPVIRVRRTTTVVLRND